MELDEKSVKIERLYALHKNVMLYTAERILRDYQLAEDAVQKAFMKVLDNLHKIEVREGSRLLIWWRRKNRWRRLRSTSASWTKSMRMC